MQGGEAGSEEIKFPNDLPDQAMFSQQGFIKYSFHLLVQIPSLLQQQKCGSRYHLQSICHSLSIWNVDSLGD